MISIGTRRRIRGRGRSRRADAAARGSKQADSETFIGWSDNNFNNLHVTISLETNRTTTSAADNSLRFCDYLKPRLLK